MSEKGANIDLLFRNGLKDFEVLPPIDVWEGIRTSPRIDSKPSVILRVAAVVAVLISVSLLVYLLNREDSVQLPGNSIALNIPASRPINVNPPVSTKYSTPYPTPVQRNTIEPGHPVIDQTITEIPNPVVSDNEYVLPVRISVFNEKTAILSDIKSGGILHSQLHEAGSKSLEVRYADLQFMPDEVKNPQRWSIGAMASPTYYSKFSSGNNAFSKELSESEQPLISYSGGVAFAYRISKRVSIQSGLYYSSLGQRVDGINSYGGFNEYNSSKGNSNFEVPTTSGTVLSDNPDVFLSSNVSNRVVTAYTSNVFDPTKASLTYLGNSITQNFSYLELPVVVRYKIVDKTIDINLIGGLAYNLLVHNSVYTTLDGGKYQIGSTKGLNPLALSSSLGMGMEYNFSGKLTLNLEPTLRYYLNPFSVTTGTFIHPYSFGIFSGVTYKF